MAHVDSKLQEFLDKNRKFAETWPTPPTMEQLRAATSKAGAVLILTCLDPRCVPEQYFGPGLGAGVIRNAGGRATKDAINSITVLRSLANAAAVLVIHHTDCGLTHLTDEGIRNDAKARTPDAAREIDATETYGSFDAADFEKIIRIDVETLRKSKVLGGLDIRGLALDTESGVVRELEV